MKADKFSEVVVDHEAGKGAKVGAITEGEGPSASKAKSAAMARTTTALRDAVGHAETREAEPSARRPCRLAG